MIDKNRWISTLPLNSDKKLNEKEYEINSDKWISAVSNKKNNNPIKKFSAIIFFFVIGLVFVSAIKNKTRNLQKEIENLRTSIDVIKIDLYQATLDHEVITSPENISKLAKIHLESDLTHYKKTQINKLTKEQNYKKIDNLKMSKRYEEEGIKEIYVKPKSVSNQIRVKVTKKIEDKKNSLKKLYNNPQDSVEMKKIQQWGFIQLVKAFLGIPIVPGR